MNTQRNAVADIARGLGIVLIVFGHNRIVQNDPGELYRVIFSFHLPLFFFLSGVFLSPEKDPATILKQRADSLLKPYFVVLLLLGAAYMIQTYAFSIDYAFGIFYAVGSSVLWTPLWFLPHLLLAQLLAAYLLRFFEPEKFGSILLVIALLLLGVPLLWFGHAYSPFTLELLPNVEHHIIGLPWSLDLLPVSTAFVIAGYFSKNIMMQTPMQGLRAALVASVVFVALHLFSHDTLDMNERRYDSIIVSSLMAFSGIRMTLGLSCCFVAVPFLARPLAQLGVASLFIFIFHGYVQGRFTGYFMSRLTDTPTLAALLGCVAGVLLPFLAYRISLRSALVSAMLLPVFRKREIAKA
ncbi:MAG TPA: acyltransferase family protein [Rhodocyclaceae bacterium]|nr:acyltransferase family protein [Rhodocyclaceae bacterium]